MGWRPRAGDQAPCSELPHGMAWGTQVPLARGRGLWWGDPKDPPSPPTVSVTALMGRGVWPGPAPPGWGTENSRVTWVVGCREDPRRSQRWRHRHPSPLSPLLGTPPPPPRVISHLWSQSQPAPLLRTLSSRDRPKPLGEWERGVSRDLSPEYNTCPRMPAPGRAVGCV